MGSTLRCSTGRMDKGTTTTSEGTDRFDTILPTNQWGYLIIGWYALTYKLVD